MTNSFNWAPFNINFESIHDNLEVGWSTDQRTVIYKVRNNTRKSLDIWAKTVMETSTNWSKDYTYCAIHDCSSFATYMTLTPYARQKMAELARWRDYKVSGRYAVLFNPSPVLNIAKGFVNSYLRRIYPDLQGNVFTDGRAAYEWVREPTGESATQSV